jgi:sporulation related protein
MKDLRDTDLRYFPDDEDDERMREYRRAKDNYEFSLEPRHIALFVMVAIISGALLFTTGYMTGKSSALKGGILAKGDETDKTTHPLDEMETGDKKDDATDNKEPEVNFYDTLDNGEMTEEKLGDGNGGGDVAKGDKNNDVTLPKGNTPKPKDDVAKNTTGDTSKLYYIRVFATKDKVKADKLLKSLKADGYPAYTKELKDGNIKVGIKWYKTKEEATKVMGDLMMDNNYKDYTPELGVGWR